MMEFIVRNEIYRLWEWMHRREGIVPSSFVCGVLIILTLDAEGGTSFVNPVEGSLLDSLLFTRNLEIFNCALVWPT
jgi:hypothetical protein